MNLIMETIDFTGLLYFQQVAKLSGNANNGDNAGFFYWNLNNASTADYVTISGRLCF